MVEVKARRTATEKRRLPQEKRNPKRRNRMLLKRAKTTPIPSPLRRQRRRRRPRREAARQSSPFQRQGKAAQGVEAKQFPTPPVLHQKPFQTPQRLLPKVQVATRSRTRSLTAPDFMVSSKGPRLD